MYVSSLVTYLLNKQNPPYLSALLFFVYNLNFVGHHLSNISRFNHVANSVHCPNRNGRCLSWRVKGSKCEKAYKGIFVSIWNNRSTIVWQGCSCNKPPPLHKSGWYYDPWVFGLDWLSLLTPAGRNWMKKCTSGYHCIETI